MNEENILKEETKPEMAHITKSVHELLNKTDIPKIELKVFGKFYLNVIVTCQSKSAIQKWINLLSSAFHKCKIKTMETMIEAKTQRKYKKAYRIYMTYR